MKLNNCDVLESVKLSLLSWERGLKFSGMPFRRLPVNVAPLVGAWIEIDWTTEERYSPDSRSSRGSVD